ncbi:unnamed protein product [Sordaria macrospora k-hell]|uniref:WGS project CABT00000000 data, contig 2.25 n=1 Tax=Sordaria macrospora (strain ATCC MYA-333 / DSM 997 / K(L3346) / K-hell) TaxID=771870 RepID=F7W3T5_SORMK|nr:uncharacterized protein SMAC_05317 [Sordaria macrospora k-hell]CCC12244.1 unnamed protein product [Sordaria macrospora k-hell]
MFSRAARLSTRVAAPIRARVAAPAPRFVIPSIAARRSVTTNAASAQLEKPLPEVRFVYFSMICRLLWVSMVLVWLMMLLEKPRLEERKTPY